MRSKLLLMACSVAFAAAQAVCIAAHARSVPRDLGRVHTASVPAIAAAGAPVVAAAPPRLVLTAPGPLPVRARRPYKIATSVGFNGLAGIGGQLSYHVNPYFALEVGLGKAGHSMPKTGLRLRSNLSARDFSPFVGLGASYVFAHANHRTRLSALGEAAPPTHVSETMAHVIFGVSDAWSNGLTLEAGVGYAKLLSQPQGSDEHIAAGAKKAPSAGRTSGPLMEITVGYSF